LFGISIGFLLGTLSFLCIAKQLTLEQGLSHLFAAVHYRWIFCLFVNTKISLI
jgi:hypothetical protein